MSKGKFASLDVTVIKDIVQRELADKARQLRSLAITCLSACQYIEEIEEGTFFLRSYISNMGESVSIKFKLDSKYLYYTEDVDGEVDNLTDISHASYVDDEGKIDGPMYYRGNSCWLMYEYHIRARETRRENGECRSSENDELIYTRMLDDDDEGFDPKSEISIYDTRKMAYDLATYYVNGQFFTNVRIMMSPYTSKPVPLAVPNDWEPEKEYKTFTTIGNNDEQSAKFIRTHFENVHQNIRVRDVKVDEDGHVIVTNVRKYVSKYAPNKCNLLKAIWIESDMNRIVSGAKIGYMKCARKMRNKNMITKTVPVEKPKKITYLSKGGISFRNSVQLVVGNTIPYSNNPRYSMNCVNAMNFYSRFMQRLSVGNVKQCTNVVYDKDGNRTAKRQVYAVLPYGTGENRLHFVVFADLRKMPQL